jgi:hypothetical protein
MRGFCWSIAQRILAYARLMLRVHFLIENRIFDLARYVKRSPKYGSGCEDGYKLLFGRPIPRAFFSFSS